MLFLYNSHIFVSRLFNPPLNLYGQNMLINTGIIIGFVLQYRYCLIKNYLQHENKILISIEHDDDRINPFHIGTKEKILLQESQEVLLPHNSTSSPCSFAGAKSCGFACSPGSGNIASAATATTKNPTLNNYMKNSVLHPASLRDFFIEFDNKTCY